MRYLNCQKCEKNLNVMLKLIRKRFKVKDKIKIKTHKDKIIIEKAE